MNNKDTQFFKELLLMFKRESEELIKTMSSGLHRLEKAASAEERFEILEVVFRAAHSLKGAARTVGLIDIESCGQSLEKIFATVKNNEVSLSTELFDKLHQALESLGGLVSSMDEQGRVMGDKSKLNRLLNELNENIVLIGT